MGNITIAVAVQNSCLEGSALTNFLMSKTGIKWDTATVSNITIDDLDKESFNIFAVKHSVVDA